MWYVNYLFFNSMKLYHMFISFVQVAQTRIQFNEKQLLQLIHQHLVSKNMVESATTLMKEAGLPPLPIKQASSSFPPYRTTSSTPATPSRSGRLPPQTPGANAVPTTPTAATNIASTPTQTGLIKVNLAAR